MTDSKSATDFFRIKRIPPSLWIACDFVLENFFTIAHIPGQMNPAANFHQVWMEIQTGKIVYKIREDVPTQPTKNSIESTGIAQENQVFFTPMTPNYHLKNNYGNSNMKKKTVQRRNFQSELCHNATKLTKKKTPWSTTYNHSKQPSAYLMNRRRIQC